MALGLETESMHLWFHHGRMDIFDFIDFTDRLGLSGVQINVVPDLNLHPQWGTLLHGTDPGYLAEIRAELDRRGMFCEIDGRGTSVEDVVPALHLCSTLGAKVFRAYVRFPGGVWDRDFFYAQEHPLRQVLPIARDHGVVLALENHEFERSTELVDLIERVGDPDRIGLLCDTGNSMMAWEGVESAVATMAPYTHAVHFKDHSVVMAGDRPVVCGVPLGDGGIDLDHAYRTLKREAPAENICLEVCYPYCAEFKRARPADSAGFTGEFAIAEPPFDPALVAPLDYYYPHTRSAEALETLLQAQRRDVLTSAEILRGLADRYEAAEPCAEA